MSYEQLKHAFFQQYCGPLRQTLSLSEIENCYFRHSDGSGVDYFLNLVAKAKYIEPPYPVSVLVAMNSRGLPTEISVSLIGTLTINQALERLRQADFVNNSISFCELQSK